MGVIPGGKLSEGRFDTKMMDRYWTEYLKQGLAPKKGDEYKEGQFLWDNTFTDALKNDLRETLVYKPSDEKNNVEWYFNTWLKQQMDAGQWLIIVSGHERWFKELIDTTPSVYKTPTHFKQLREADGSVRKEHQLETTEMARIEVEMVDGTPKISSIP